MPSVTRAIYQALYVQGRGALRRNVACLRHRAGAADAEGAHAQARRAFVSSDNHDQPTFQAEGSRSAVPALWEGDLIIGLKVPRSAPW